MKYSVIIAGTTYRTYNNRADAEKTLEQVRNSYFALVHPRDTMYIREEK